MELSLSICALLCLVIYCCQNTDTVKFGAEYQQCWCLEHYTANSMINSNTGQSRISLLTAVNFIAERRTNIQTQRIGTGKNKYNQVIMMLRRHVKKHGHKGEGANGSF